jgi:hypothetical protein
MSVAVSEPVAEEKVNDEASALLLPQVDAQKLLSSGPAPTSMEPLPTNVPLVPAPVTDEEIAALLDSAFLSCYAAVPVTDQRPAEVEDPAAEIPRRRNLPRRSDAA